MSENKIDYSAPESSEKLTALDELFQKSKTYIKSPEYLDLLHFIRKFPILSPYNAFLIHMQNRGVELVMSRNKWLKKGRKVKPFARPLVILIPFGPVEFVYDIADTEEIDPELLPFIPEQLVNPFSTKGEFDVTLYSNILSSCKKEYIKVEEYSMHRNAAGYARFIDGEFKIFLNNQHGINEKYSTIIHELAHILCGHLGNFRNRWWPDRKKISKDIREIEAESVSFLVCKRNGLNTQSESYLNTYVAEHDEMPLLSLEIILTVSGYIEKMYSNNFTPKK